MTGERAGGEVGEPWAGMAMGQGPSCGQGTPRAGTEHIVVPQVPRDTQYGSLIPVMPPILGSPCSYAIPLQAPSTLFWGGFGAEDLCTHVGLCPCIHAACTCNAKPGTCSFWARSPVICKHSPGCFLGWVTGCWGDASSQDEAAAMLGTLAKG